MSERGGGKGAGRGPERTLTVRTLEDFDRELARDGGEALRVPRELALEYGLFPEDVGTEEEIRLAGADGSDPGEAKG